MVQRIQTIFLLLAGAVLFALFVPVFSFVKIEGDTSGKALQDGVLSLADSAALQLPAALAGVLFILTIFLFKNRKQQLRLAQSATLVCAALIAIAAYIFYVGTKESGGYVHVSPQIGGFFPVLSFIFGLLAARFIRKDEKLVRSSYDRLR